MYQKQFKLTNSKILFSKQDNFINLKKKKNLKYKYKEYNKKIITTKKTDFIKYLKIQKNSIQYLNKITKHYNEINNKYIQIYIKVTLNNIFVTYFINNKIYTKSIASLGFKGKSKQTIYAYKTFAESILKDLQNLSSNQSIIVNLYIKSLSKKLKPLYHIFKVNNIKINKIYDTTSQSFNGCRKRKIAIKKKRKSVIKFLSYL